MIYRRSRIESGKKGARCGKSWSPETHVVTEKLEGELSLVARCLNPMQGFQTQGKKDRNRNPNSIWWRKSVGVQSTWERKEIARDSGTTFPALSTYCHTTSLGSVLPGPPATGNTNLLCLKGGPAGCTPQAPLRVLFFWSFGKENILPHLQGTASMPSPTHWITGPTLPLYNSTLLSSVAQGDHSALQNCDFQSISQGNFCLRIRQADAGLCGYITGAEWGSSSLSCKRSLCYPGTRKLPAPTVQACQ